MSTVSEFIIAKFSKFGVQIPDSEIEYLGIQFGFDPIETLSTSNTTSAKLAIARAIPEMLLIPNISEGGYSVSHSNAGLLQYYNFLCDELGIENMLKPKVNNQSNRW